MNWVDILHADSDVIVFLLDWPLNAGNPLIKRINHLLTHVLNLYYL